MCLLSTGPAGLQVVIKIAGMHGISNTADDLIRSGLRRGKMSSGCWVITRAWKKGNKTEGNNGRMIISDTEKIKEY